VKTVIAVHMVLACASAQAFGQPTTIQEVKDAAKEAAANHISVDDSDTTKAPKVNVDDPNALRE